MAEALARSLVFAEVRSAGVAADQGGPASAQAIEVMRRRGHDVTAHRSQLVSEELLDWADLVLTMTRQHKQILLERFPGVGTKVYTLKEYALDAEERQNLTHRLHDLYARMDEKRRAFGSRYSPNIAELQEKRALLVAELARVEQDLAELQSKLREELHTGRSEIDALEMLISEQDVADPFGQPTERYESCAVEIMELLQRVASKLREGSK
jgi:protein-tyrosine phosphatase